jgi:hypothetical protein
MTTPQAPSNDKRTHPMIDLVCAIGIEGKPSQIWPWIVQVGYHRRGWYIDKWWGRIEQDVF